MKFHPENFNPPPTPSPCGIAIRRVGFLNKQIWNYLSYYGIDLWWRDVA